MQIRTVCIFVLEKGRAVCYNKEKITSHLFWRDIMKKYILALDEGTTSARAILFDRDMHIVSMAQHEFAQYYPNPGWVEQDPMDIYANQ